MKTTTIRESAIVPGARFQMQRNDPAQPGALVWADVTVIDGAPIESLGGVGLYPVRYDSDGRTVRAAAGHLRPCA